MVRAAVAHFNLSAIHPFLDGNGRLARALHSLVLMQGGIVAPPFASIDEYLSVNGGAYDLALRSTHGGRWQPERDARPFVRFCSRRTTSRPRCSGGARRSTTICGKSWNARSNVEVYPTGWSRRSPRPPLEA